MDAAKVVIVNQQFARSVNAVWIARTIPADYENVMQPPAAVARFTPKLRVGVLQFVDAVHPFAANRSAAALR